MKVNETGQPPTPGVSSAEAADAPTKPGKLGGAGGGVAGDEQASTVGSAFADRLSAGRATEAAARADRVARVGDVAVDDLAADLRAGKVTPQAAIDSVVERVVATQVGPDAPATVREQVRAALQNAIEDDPLVAAKLARLQS